MLDVARDFPFLERRINGRPIVYLDSAATTQKPWPVIDRVHALYAEGIANVHRAVNQLAEDVTDAYEDARQTTARFINADADEIVFTANATAGMNLVAGSLPPGSRVILTAVEHHSNLLPWRARADVRTVRVDATGLIDLDDLRRAAAEGAQLATIARTSNAFGVVQPVAAVAQICREAGIPLLIDASQSIAHDVHDVRAMQCDYLVFSGHKVYGPSGVGVLFVRRQLAERMQPLLYGGHMVKEVSADGHVLQDMPHRFEAGTPNIEGVIGLGAALDFVSDVGLDRIKAHESALAERARLLLDEIPGVQRFGPTGETAAPLVPFTLATLEHGAVAKLLGNRWNIIVRSGFHCAQPGHHALSMVPTVRASFAMYNTMADVELLGAAVASLAGAAAV